MSLTDGHGAAAGQDELSSGMSRAIAPPLSQELLAIAEDLRRHAADEPLLAPEIVAAARRLELLVMGGSPGLAVPLHDAARRVVEKLYE